MPVLGANARALEELFRDPVLTVACVLLMVVSIGWIVVTRVIVRLLRRAALRGRAVPRIDVVRPPRDIWSYPPEAPYDHALDRSV
ncbi:MAG: hypothetical protein M3277_09370 [Actinomycetota bacterium]|nr:hypothetical protein [Actinomycetota bacterium]